MDDDPLAPTPIDGARKSQLMQTEPNSERPEHQVTKPDLRYFPEVATLVSRYDPLAPTPERKTNPGKSSDATPSNDPKDLKETVQAELTLKDKRDEDIKKRHSEASEQWRIERESTERSYELEAQKLRIRGTTLNQEFEHAATGSEETPKPKQPTQDKTVGWRSTTNVLVEIKQEQDTALDKHNLRWRIHEQRLSAQSLPAPTPPAGAIEQQSIKNKYKEARQHWEAQRESIDDKFDTERDLVREKGVTLTDLHQRHANGEQEAAPTEPAVVPREDLQLESTVTVEPAPMDTGLRIPVQQAHDITPVEPSVTSYEEPQPDIETSVEPASMEMDVGSTVPEVQEVTPSHDFASANGEMSQGHEM